MTFEQTASHGAVKIQVGCDLNISIDAQGLTSGSYPPAKEFIIQEKGYDITSVKVAGETYTEVATSGALAQGTYFVDKSGTSVDILHIQAKTVRDEEQFLEFESNPTNSDLVVDNLGEAIPSDALTFDEFQGFLAIGSEFEPSEITQAQRDWMVYMALQEFFYYAVETSTSVYGYYEPYFYRGSITNKKGFYDAFNEEYNTDSGYFDYTSYSTMQSNYGGLRDAPSGSIGWYVIIKYVSSTTSTPALSISAKKENYLNVSGERNFNGFLVTGGTTHDLDLDNVRIDFRLSFAKHADLVNDIYQEPRVISTPKIEKRIEPLFGKPIQRGGGTLILNNSDGYFDKLKSYIWSGNTVELISTVALPTQEFSAGQSQVVGKFLMTDVTFSKETVKVKVEELSKHFMSGFPLRFFDEIIDANNYEDNLGRHIPYIYGRVYGVKAIPVKKSLNLFQVADHQIHSVSNPLRRVNGEWQPAYISSTDYESGRFSLQEWEDGQEVLCDVNGYVGTDGKLMNNPADIVKHILDKVNFADVNQSSIDNSRNYYEVGTSFPYNRVDKEVGLYIDEPGKLEDIFKKINQSSISYLRFNNDYEIEFKAWYPIKRTGIAYEIQDHELLSYELLTSEKDIITELHSIYQNHVETEEKRIITINSQGKYKYNLGGERVKDFDSGTGTLELARNLGKKMMTILEDEQRFFKVRLKFRPIPWLPGDQIRLKINRYDYNEIVEILRVSIDLMTGTVDLTLGNRRNWLRSSGWIADSSATAYSLFDSDEEKQKDFEENGFYSDNNGYLDDQDNFSFLTTRYL